MSQPAVFPPATLSLHVERETRVSYGKETVMAGNLAHILFTAFLLSPASKWFNCDVIVP